MSRLSIKPTTVLSMIMWDKGPDWIRFRMDLDTDEDIDDDETSSDRDTDYLVEDGLDDGTSSATSDDHVGEDQTTRKEFGPLPLEAVYAALYQDAFSTLPNPSPERSSDKRDLINQVGTSRRRSAGGGRSKRAS